MAQKIRLLLVDDHALLREGIRAFLTTREDVELVGEADNGEEGVRLALELRPDVILMDLLMPGMDGVEAIRRILMQNPAARILVLTSFAADEQITLAMRAGAAGYLLKESTAEQMLQAVRDVHHGLTVMHPRVVDALVKGLQNTSLPSPDALTDKEKEVLALLAQGLSNHQIAQRLSLSEWTVRTHVRNILGKLHLQNRTQAALYALREGLADSLH
ncbi:MAG: response regulator transcription factor [Anaerolineae bacterium]|nr:response regulator transcription factor [Anaerolineae bacterium]